MENKGIFGILIKDLRQNKSVSQEKRVSVLTSICKLAKGLDIKVSELIILYEEKLLRYRPIMKDKDL